jgi:hypothetical protein
MKDGPAFIVWRQFVASIDIHRQLHKVALNPKKQRCLQKIERLIHVYWKNCSARERRKSYAL